MIGQGTRTRRTWDRIKILLKQHLRRNKEVLVLVLGIEHQTKTKERYFIRIDQNLKTETHMADRVGPG